MKYIPVLSSYLSVLLPWKGRKNRSIDLCFHFFFCRPDPLLSEGSLSRVNEQTPGMGGPTTMAPTQVHLSRGSEMGEKGSKKLPG